MCSTPTNDADWRTNDLQQSARDASNGVCSICEDLLTDEAYGPICSDLPYHVECLAEGQYV